MRKLFLIAIAIFTLQSCSQKMAPISLSSSKWMLTDWPNQKIPDTDKKALLNFENNDRVSGKSFCNGFGGTVKLSGEKIKFSNLLGTMIYCDDVGNAEAMFTAALLSANSFNIVNGKLQLLKDGKVILIFTKTT